MRKVVIAAASVLLVVMLPLTASAVGSTRLQASLHPTGDLNVRGVGIWPAMSEQTPIFLVLRGAQPSSHLLLRVCGPTVNAETGAVFDHCWATFVDQDRHLTDIAVDGKGQVTAQLYPKLGVGPVVLSKAERLEVYASGNTSAPIAVGDLRGWGTVASH